MTPENLVELLQNPKVTAQLSQLAGDPVISRGIAQLLKDPSIQATLAGIVDMARLGLIALVVLGGLNLLGLLLVAGQVRRLGRSSTAARPPGPA